MSVTMKNHLDHGCFFIHDENMNTKIRTSDVPKNADTRHSWVLFHFHLRKISLNRLAKEHGVSVSAMSAAFHRPYLNCEAILAKAMGLKAHELFPERYDAQGNRLPHLIRRGQRTTPGRAINVKSTGSSRHAG